MANGAGDRAAGLHMTARMSSTLRARIPHLPDGGVREPCMRQQSAGARFAQLQYTIGRDWAWCLRR